MLTLVRFFWQLCLLRRGPQDLPASLPLLAWLALLNVLIGTTGTLSHFGGASRAFAASVLDTLIVAGLVYATLAFAGHRPRLVQVLTAVYGIGVLFGAAFLPVQLLAGNAEALGLLVLANLVALAWIHVALGHVLRHALELDLWAGIAIAIGYTVIGVIVVNTYLPPVVGSGG